jgi:hypothetical protein
MENRMKCLLAVMALAVVALWTGVGSATAAPPNFTAGQKLCEAQGGVYALTAVNRYQCDSVDGSISERELGTARKLCVNGYAGHFQQFGPSFDVVAYGCFN